MVCAAPVSEKMTVTVQVEDESVQDRVDLDYPVLENLAKGESIFSCKNIYILTSLALFILTGFIRILVKSSKST